MLPRRGDAQLTGGSAINPVYTVRPVKQVVVYETELDHIGMLNTLASSLFSAASAFFLFAVGLVTSWLIQGKLTDKGAALLQFGAPVGALLGIALLVLGVWTSKTRNSTVQDLKNSAVEVTPQRLGTQQAMQTQAPETGEPQTSGA